VFDLGMGSEKLRKDVFFGGLKMKIGLEAGKKRKINCFVKWDLKNLRKPRGNLGNLPTFCTPLRLTLTLHGERTPFGLEEKGLIITGGATFQNV